MSWWRSEVLSQVEEFKHLEVLFMTERRTEQEINRWISAASAVVLTLHGSVVGKRKLSQKARLSVYRSVYLLEEVVREKEV